MSAKEHLPPHSIEAEQSVLGSILVDRDVINDVAEFLHPPDFYRVAHSVIYRTMLDLFERREPIDVLTVSEALERAESLGTVGGRSYIASLSSSVGTSLHAVKYARIVEHHAVMRGLIGAAGEIAEIGYSGVDAREAIDLSEAELYRVASRRAATAGFRPLKELLHEAYDNLEHLHAHRGEVMGIPSGFHDLDHLTTGFQKSDLIICAARPSVGKTSFALNVAEHAALREQKKVGIFSLEMSKEQLVMRLVSSVAEIDSKRLRTGYLDVMDFGKIAPTMERLSKADLFIDDTPNLTSMELRTKARRLQAKEGLDLVIVDYLQLMQSTGTSDGNRVQEVSEISRGLKALARELTVPVLALSQLSRNPESRDTGEPRLSDLRDSGAIEQDADLVIFLWRDKGKAPSSSGEIVNLKLAKHRNGPTGELGLWFKSSQTRFATVYPKAD